MGNSKVKIEATVAADIKKVWSYWNSPKHIVKWNFAVDDWHCPRAENDLKVGGKLKSRMEAKDGSFGFDFEGTYSEVVEPKKIAYTIADGRRVETVFENIGGTTQITTTFDAENQNPIEMQQKGWQAILNNFKKYTEEN
jgi:uncharacterized protein YndB with AHSA1/START domain